jgi:two-component system sensor histidine kinase KdpD
MSNQRPDPQALLARVQAEEARAARGRLKIFFGAAPGVGKTYAMLAEARALRAAGREVLVGVVETHGRAETEALLADLEVLPRQAVAYRGVELREFDLDAALERRPALLLVDELAHTNAPGARHSKRWQDVQELLAAGVSVFTTLNVQHLESLNDVVAQITGVVVRETVPDSLVEQADEIELVDLPPEELLERLRAGKVYLPQQAEQAGRHFFRKGNLIALRELALRRTAERVDAQMEHYRRDQAIAEPWPAHDRLLVWLDLGPLGPRLVRAARRMAGRLRSDWIVAYVEQPDHARQPEPARDQLTQTLRLAQQLGAEVVTLSGASPSEALLAYARTRNVAKILVGKSQRPRWRELVFGSPVDELIRHSGVIDVYVISGEADEQPPAPSLALEPSSPARAYVWAAAVVVCCTLLAELAHPTFELTNLVMFYLLGVLLVALRIGRGPAIVASVLSVASFDFFFVQPYLTFVVSDSQYLLTFAVMLSVALVISTLTTRLRQQAEGAIAREQRTAALYRLSRELAAVRSIEQVLAAVVQMVSETFGSAVVLLLPVREGRLQPWGTATGWWGSQISEPMVFAPDARDRGVAQWVYERGELAGLGTSTLPSAGGVYVPLRAAHGTVGVLGLKPRVGRQRLTPEQQALLDAFASQTALAIERIRLVQEAQAAQIQAETERTRAVLFSSVSHDLRTPLATISGAAATLSDDSEQLAPPERRELAQMIADQAGRLTRLVRNLMELARLESGALPLRTEPQAMEEVVGAALTRLEGPLGERPVELDLPDSLPLVPLDAVLFEQVLINLIENALRYTPADSPIALSARAEADSLTLSVADRGPGIPAGDEERVFEKFYRAPGATADGGVGLGLAICRAIVSAHGGRIWASSLPSGGAQFQIRLPLNRAALDDETML